MFATNQSDEMGTCLMLIKIQESWIIISLNTIQGWREQTSAHALVINANISGNERRST